MGLRFSPCALPNLLNVSAEDLTNLRVPLGDIRCDRSTTEFVARIADGADPAYGLEAHLIREANELTGQPFGRLITA
ncbi:MAG: hypothetical protein WAW17_04830 [Rhodococcus sp. (in: high G+C Gram-positive bacteria)]|uniref:hypothetical protein n=1 Tax=Rhodococcus sp. TaxID=1831 RepID=UPI003BAFEFAE